MIATVDHLLAVFTTTYGRGLCQPRARCALAAALAEERRLAAVPEAPSEIKRRRLEVHVRPAFERVELATGYTRAELVASPRGLPKDEEQRRVAARDWLCAELARVRGMSLRKIGALLGMCPEGVRLAVSRHEGRRVAVVARPAMAAVAAAPLLRAVRRG